MPAANEILRERILDAAIELFFSQGYQQTSLRQIADRVGASHGSIRYHFGSKDDVYRAAIHQLDPRNICTQFPPVPPAAEMTKAQAIRLFREHVLILATVQARAGASAALALPYTEGQGAPGSPPNREFYKRVVAPGHDSFKRIIQAIRPDIEDDGALEILAFNVIFQCVMLRSGRGIILKRLKKRTLSKEDISRIAELVIEVSLAGICSLSPSAK